VRVGPILSLVAVGVALCHVSPGRAAAGGAVSDHLAREARLVAQGRVRPEDASFFLRATRRGPGKGAVVLLHGFPGTPAALRGLAAQIRKQGYDVFAPRELGHGRSTRSGAPDWSHMPRSTEAKRFGEWPEQAVQMLRHDRPDRSVYVIGASGGGTAAVWLWSQKPETPTLAFAPYVSPAGSWKLRALAGIVTVGDQLSGGLLGRLLDRVPMSDDGFTVGHALAFLKFARSTAQSVARRGKQGGERLTIVTTAADETASAMAAGRKLARSSGARWLEYARPLNVSHEVGLTADADTPAVRRATFDIIKAFLADRRKLLRPHLKAGLLVARSPEPAR
jgi:pimeloyl-ACP methyl ester carboxylesterase